MKKSSGAGIGGILDRIISPGVGQVANVPDAPTGQNVSLRSPTSHKRDENQNTQPQIHARRGRPLGKQRKSIEPKGKLTVWLSANLIAHYREWSWDARCHLSALVERALVDYSERHSRRRDDVGEKQVPG